MKHFIAGVILFGLMAILAIACRTKPVAQSAVSQTAVTAQPAQRPAPFIVLQHKNAALGGEIPSWVFMEASAIEVLPEYKDSYIFVFDGTGQDLEATRLKINNLNAAAEIARFISLRVQALFAAAQVGSDRALATYMENVVTSLSQVQIVGFRKVGDYWLQRQFRETGATEYVYKTLYSIDKKTVRRLIDNATASQGSGMEASAKRRVENIIQGNLPALNSN